LQELSINRVLIIHQSVINRPSIGHQSAIGYFIKSDTSWLYQLPIAKIRYQSVINHFIKSDTNQPYRLNQSIVNRSSIRLQNLTPIGHQSGARLVSDFVGIPVSISLPDWY
jgi:hypothetical protein